MLKKVRWLSVIVVISLLAAALYLNQQKEIANQQKEIANMARDTADSLALVAQDSARVAKEQRDIAQKANEDLKRQIEETEKEKEKTSAALQGKILEEIEKNKLKFGEVFAIAEDQFSAKLYQNAKDFYEKALSVTPDDRKAELRRKIKLCDEYLKE